MNVECLKIRVTYDTFYSSNLFHSYIKAGIRAIKDNKDDITYKCMGDGTRRLGNDS